MGATTPRSGRPSDRLQRRSAARPRRCDAGYVGTNAIRAKAPGAATAEQERVKTLEREVKELRRANEILRLASAFFAQAELDRRLKS